MTNSPPLRPLPPEGFPDLGGGLDLLLYDGDCRFCRASAGRLARLAGPKLRLVSLHEPGLLEALAISLEAAMQAMHLVTPEGRVFGGLEAAVQALRHRSIIGVLAKAYYLPGLRQLGDLGYRLVARYRYAILGRAVAAGQCDGGSCQLHLKKP
jgi:predicted DCC family thiol-disulfide oxidoreductase YuxK